MNQLLYGSNPEEKIVAVHPASDHSMRVYSRTSGGIVSNDVEFYPFFFLSNSKYLKGYPKKHWIKELSGNNYYRYLCAFGNWLEQWDAIRHVLERYNENAPTKLNSYTELPVIHVRTDPIEQFLKQSGRTLFKGMEFDDLHRCQINIKTYTKHGFKFSNPHRPEDRIIIITLTDNRGWEHIISGKRKNEKEMLYELILLIQERDPDIIEGHNIFNFDLPFIMTRCEMHGVDFAVGRDSSSPHSFDTRLSFTERSLDYSSYEIAGRHMIDTFQLMQSYDVSKRTLESYELKYAAQHFGFENNDRVYITPDRVSWYWENEPETLLRNSRDDVCEIRYLSEQLSPSYFYMTQMLPFNFGTVARIGASAKIESLLLREYIRRKHSVPKPEVGSPVSGGYTDIFYTGVLGPIIDVDVESLYPSIMLNENIAPATEKLDIFLPILKELTNLRLDAKRRMKISTELSAQSRYDAIQSAFKILINSFYGYLGYGRALFNDYKAADKVVELGQKILRLLIHSIIEYGGMPVEVDTDGVFFVPPKSILSEKEEKIFIKRLEQLLPSGIHLEINGRYKKILSYKKKNYALLRYDDKIIIKGSSLISRSMERFCRDFIHHCLEALLNENVSKIHNYYVEYHQLVTTRRLSVKDFSRTEVLRDSYEDYMRAIEAGTRNRSASYEIAIAAGFSWKPGDRISYYFTVEDTNIKGYENCKLARDWDPNFPDENVSYYLKRLDECAKKFEDFFGEQDYHSIFSVEDLFGFSSKGKKIITLPIKIDSKETIEEETEPIHVEPRIWLDEDLS